MSALRIIVLIVLTVTCLTPESVIAGRTKRRLNALEMTVDTLSESLDELVDSDNVIQAILYEMNSTIHDLQRSIETLFSSQDSLLNADEVTDARLNEMNSRIQDLEQEEAVVFSVELTTTLPDISAPTTVVFDHVATNAGDGYNSESGIFTAPKAGYYSISASLMSCVSSRFWVMLNGESVEYIAAAKGEWNADSGTVNLELAKGDRVWIEAIGTVVKFTPCWYEQRFGSQYKCYHSSFSGFLIQEI